MVNSPKDVALAYVELLGKKQIEQIRPLLADDMHFKGPAAEYHTAEQFMAALQRLVPTIKAFYIRKVFVDGDDVCVIYDYDTPTSIGAVPISEWLTVRGGKIVKDELLFDRVSFGQIVQEVSKT